jgi:4-amino-4-deoxy-L-arabinose transferase-like glycosyltransferase
MMNLFPSDATDGMTPRARVAVFLLIGTILGAVAFSTAPQLSLDSRHYMEVARQLQSDPASVLFSRDRATWTAVLLPAIISVSAAVTPDHWPSVIVAINVIAMSLAGMLLLDLVLLVTKSRVATLIAACFYLASYDLLTWLRFVLTDMMFTLLAVLALWLVVRGVMNPGLAVRRRWILAGVLAAAFVTRPSGAILIPVAGFVEWWAHRPNPRSLWAMRLPWFVMLLILVSGFVVRAWFYADMNRWPTDFLRPVLEEYSGREKTGEVVWDRLETHHAPPTTTMDHLLIELDRFARFFQFTSSNYSRIHNVVNVVYFVPLYLLVLYGIASGLRGEDEKRRKVIILAALCVIAVAWLHALTILDYDWRYRLPMLPFLVLLAGCGGDAAVRAMFRRQRNTSTAHS